MNDVVHEPKRLASDPAIGPELGMLIERSRPAGPLPAEARAVLSSIPGHTLENIRIHDDSAAHEAARGLGARAFTVGRSIYFGHGEYRPATRAGLRVLAHEGAHAHQQASASLPSADQLALSSPSSREETDAERFADALDRGASPAVPAQLPFGNVARVMREVTFTAGANQPTLFDIKERINPVTIAAGQFTFGGGGGPEMVIHGITYPAEPYLFSWQDSVQIHGEPDDSFSNWEVGMLQTVLDYRFDVWWGAGANEKNCSLKFKNCHDGFERASPWFNPDPKSNCRKGPFTADGETLEIEINDSPFAQVPYQNIKGGPSENFGRFDFDAGFITYVSAHNIAAGDTVDAFRQLKSVRWQTTLKGRFDGRTSPPQVHAEGGTSMGGITDFISPSSEARPVTGGELAFDKMQEIMNCWTPEKK